MTLFAEFANIIVMLIDILFGRNGALTRETLLEAVAYIVALLIAILLHEIAHGLVALWNGDDTARVEGRLSVNPAKHFDLFGFLMLLVVGFGWAKPVPINPNNFKKKNVGIITVSLAGIIVNFLLAFLFSAAYVLLSQNATVEIYSAAYYVVYFFLYLFAYLVVINISLALFNFLPLYPLDGYRFFASIFGENGKVMTFLRKYSLYILLIFVLWDMMPDVISQYSPLSLYINYVGSAIRSAFFGFWGLFV